MHFEWGNGVSYPFSFVRCLFSKGAEFSLVENGAFGSSSVVFAGEQLALDCSEEKRHCSEFASILPE